MAGKGKKVLLTLLEIALFLAALFLLWMAWNNFFDILHRERFPAWMVSRESPYWEDALHKVEDYQWEIGIINFLFGLCPGALLGAGAAALALWRRGRTRWWALVFLIGVLALGTAFLAAVLYGGWSFFGPLLLISILLFLYCLHKAREKRRKPYEHQTSDNK